MSLITGITRGIDAAEGLIDEFVGAVTPFGFGGTFQDFVRKLQPASFRGVPFGILVGEGRFGRSIALHEYPFRDKPWPEDMGRATRKFTIQGFLITDSLVYGGGDVKLQIQQMITAVEAQGAGTLVHPTLGRLQVAIPEDGLILSQGIDGATFAEFSLACFENGDRTFPAASASQAGSGLLAALAADLKSAQAFVDRVEGVIDIGHNVIAMAVKVAGDWVGLADDLAKDATGIFNMAASLPGNFGRFFNGALVGFSTGLTPAAKPPTLESLVFTATQDRAAVEAAGVALVKAADDMEPGGVPPAAQAVCAALMAAVVNPADGVRLFLALADFYPDAPTGDSEIGQASATMQIAMGAVLRRAALASLVRIADAYQPQSEDDANNVRRLVCDALAAESLIAGDAGDDSVCQAMTDAAGAVSTIQDGRGAKLPPMREFSFQVSLPSLAAAQRLYQDADRADELVRLANARHPAFMPLTFRALSS